MPVYLHRLMKFLDGRGAARAIGDITCPWWLFLFFYIDLTYHCFLILQRNNKISGVKRKQNKHNKMGRNRKEVFIMRKMITMAVTAALAISTLTACGKTDKKETTASTAATTASTASTAATTASTEAKTEAKAEAKDTSAAAAESKADAQTPVSGSVATDGSTSMEKVIGALGEAFTKANPDATFTYNPTGSGSGITAVSEGRCDIGLSSRALKDDEKSQGLVETTLALDGIAIIVNKENTVEDLSLDDIAKIYTGEITNWSEVGGEDADIVLIGREAGSGTRDGFESITGTSDSCKYRQELTSTGDVITTVSSNPGAIGYASLAAVKDTVKKVSVDGVEATEETVKDGSYKVQRPFVLVTKDGTELSEAAQAFFDYATSKDAADIILAAGAVAVAE